MYIKYKNIDADFIQILNQMTDIFILEIEKHYGNLEYYSECLEHTYFLIDSESNKRFSYHFYKEKPYDTIGQWRERFMLSNGSEIFEELNFEMLFNKCSEETKEKLLFHLNHLRDT